jgi:hypothetical protein
MDLVPRILEHLGRGSHTHRKASEVPVEDLKSRLHDQKPEVTGAGKQRLDEFELTVDVNRRAIEGFAVLGRKKRRRQDAFRLREKI